MAEDIEAQLAAARALQAATSETLRLISDHPDDLSAVLTGILATAAELSGGEAGSIILGVGGTPRIVASHGPPMQPYVGMALPADAADIGVVFELLGEARHVDDFTAAASSLAPYWQDMAATADIRSYGFTLLQRGNERLGSLHMFRHEVRPFSKNELDALVAFGEQASLAVANAQLFNDLDQALERQRAMTDVLEAVSTARFDIQPVFDRIVEHAAHLCDRTATLVTIRDRADLSVVAGAGWDERGLPDRVFNWETIDTTSTTGTVFSTGEPVHIRDWDEVPSDVYPNSQARDTGLRTLMTLPMGRHGEVIGAITFIREAPGSHRRRQRPPPAGDRRTQQRPRRVAGTPDGHERHPRADQLEPWRPDHGPAGHRCTGSGAVRRRQWNGPAPPR
jgi:GAF domain-containing protein